MTILDDHSDQAADIEPTPEAHVPAEVPEDFDDRRRTAGGPRLSWASSEPFVARRRVAEDRVTGRDVSGWHATAAAYVRHALTVDLLVASVVVLLVLFVMQALDGPRAVWSVAVGVVFVVLIAAFGGYDHKSLGDGPEEFRSVLRAGVGAVATVGLVSVALAVDMPRGVVGSTVLAVVPAVVVGRYGLRQSLHSRRSRGEAMSRTLVHPSSEGR